MYPGRATKWQVENPIATTSNKTADALGSPWSNVAARPEPRYWIIGGGVPAAPRRCRGTGYGCRPYADPGAGAAPSVHRAVKDTPNALTAPLRFHTHRSLTTPPRLPPHRDPPPRCGLAATHPRSRRASPPRRRLTTPPQLRDPDRKPPTGSATATTDRVGHRLGNRSGLAPG